MNLPLVLAIAIAISCASAPASAQTGSAPGRIPTVTRLVKIIGGLEEELAASVRSGNSAAVERMLTDDFELRIGSSPGTPIPRADWLRSALAKAEAPSALEQISVHEFGEIAIASFLATAPATASKSAPTFLVDVWKRSGDSWKLAVRYAGPAGAPDFPITGADARTPAIPRK